MSEFQPGDPVEILLDALTLETARGTIIRNASLSEGWYIVARDLPKESPYEMFSHTNLRRPGTPVQSVR